MKQTNFLKSLFLLFALIVGSTSVWADTYTLVKNVSELSQGDVILITNGKANGSNYAMGTYSDGNNVPAKSITISKETISSLGDAQEITLESKNAGGNFTLKQSANNYFYAANSSGGSKNYLKTKNDNAVYWSITVNTTSYVAAITDVTSDCNGRNKLKYNYNNGSPLFSCYSAADDNLFIFKKQAAPAYTITAQSNDNELGTVSLLGSIITGSPKSGCRYASPAYTVSPANSATVSQNGNAFTVTPSANTTVTINFEEIPTHTLNTAVAPVSSGTITLGATSVLEGATTTATAAAEEGYKFTGWSITGDGATLSSTSTNPTTVTMGTADATVTANFEAIEYYPIHWSVNGSIVKTDYVKENTAIDFPTSISGIPAGFVLKGWVTEANKIDTPTDTDPSANYVTSATSTAEITYYAVMAVGHEEEITGELKGSDITSKFSNHGYSDDEETETIDGVDWTFKGSRGAANPWMQIRSDATASYIMMEADGPISSVYLQISNASNSSGGVNDISKHGDFGGTVYLESEYQSSPSGELGYSTVPEDDKEVTINVSPSKRNSTVVIQASGACRIWDVKATYTGTFYSNYCTTIPTNVQVTISDAKYATFSSPYRLNFEGSGVKAYKAISTGDTSVTLEEMTVVDANVGVLLYADVNKNTNFNIPVTTADTSEASDNLLVSTAFASYTVTGEEKGTAYVFGKLVDEVGFFKADVGKIIGVGKSWLLVPGTGGAKDVEFLSFVFGDEEQGETDGIKAVSTKVENGVRYNLAGQKVGADYKGIVIVNGKKVIRK